MVPVPTGPRWLDDREMDAWLAVIGMIVRLPAALDRQLRRDAGISHFDYQVLVGLSAAEGRRRRMSDLAEFTESSLSRLSHCVGRLEERGWVTRQVDPDDGRATIATLTDAGMAALTSAAPGHVEAVRRYVLDALSASQVDQLREIASRIVDAVGEAAPATGPGGSPTRN